MATISTFGADCLIQQKYHNPAQKCKTNSSMKIYNTAGINIFEIGVVFRQKLWESVFWFVSFL